MSDIYLYLNGQQEGPYQPPQLRQMLAEGKVTGETPAWHQGLAEWSTVAQVLSAFPLSDVPPAYVPPVPLPPVPKKGMSGGMIAAIIVAGCFVILFILPCLAGIALGPITAGITKAKENSSMQQARSIALLMYAYSVDHNGNYPDGTTSTEVFQKLIDEKYVSDPAMFYIRMEGKTKPDSTQLKPENVCFDVTSGIKTDSPNSLPVVFLTGYSVTYTSGADAIPDPDAKRPFRGIAVAYKNNSARFLKALPNHTIARFISADFNPGAESYRQLKP